METKISLPCVLHPVESMVDPVKVTHQPTKPKNYFNIILTSNEDGAGIIFFLILAHTVNKM
jgi:hypothetical protein